MSREHGGRKKHYNIKQQIVQRIIFQRGKIFLIAYIKVQKHYTSNMIINSDRTIAAMITTKTTTTTTTTTKQQQQQQQLILICSDSDFKQLEIFVILVLSKIYRATIS